MPAPSPPVPLLLAECTVPRYTSYPTAPHFSAAVGAERYAEWLDALDPGDTLSLYLHVPFCRALCHYCGCHTKATRRSEPVDSYAATLADEIALVARLSGSQRAGRIHWGGGTPSILGEAGLARLCDRLAAAFDLTSLAEHAIELDPRYVTPWLARTLAGLGVNRASLGVQELSPKVQAAIGRKQPFEVVRHAVDCLREAGIGAVNIDLMYGLPHQTEADVRQTAARAAGLGAQRLALFGYAHVPWFKPNQRLIDDTSLPGAAERLAQAEAARAVLVEHGYVPVGLDHFALPDDRLARAARAGTLHRNFQGYTVDDSEALIGLGASSIGRLPQGFVQNAPDVGNWSRAVAAGRLPTVRGLALSDDDRLRAGIIERLMCDLEVEADIAGLADPGVLALLEGEGIVAVDGTRLTVTERGRPFARLAASAFDTYLNRGAARHSVAV